MTGKRAWKRADDIGQATGLYQRVRFRGDRQNLHANASIIFWVMRHTPRSE